MPAFLMEKNDLHVGDTLRIRIGDADRTFTLKTVVKDAAFGNDMVGMSRIFMNSKMYEEFKKAGNERTYSLYFINVASISDFTEAQNMQSFPSVLNTVSRSMYSMIYSFVNSDRHLHDSDCFACSTLYTAVHNGRGVPGNRYHEGNRTSG